jgi:ectoine hydroxylase-related dioxygenase (phytanoyl-CoA dioxygenase family)
VFSSDEVARLLDALALAGITRTRAGARHLLSQAAVAAVANDPRLLRIAHEFLRAEPFAFRATLFDKSAAANWLVAWHQDTALPLRERRDVPGWGPWSVKAGVHYAHAPAAALERVVALRLHLDDSTTENGPLRVLPETHTRGVLSDAELAALAVRIAPIECTARRGGVVAMRPLLVHASSKSSALGQPRRVLHIEYAAAATLAPGLALAIV